MMAEKESPLKFWEDKNGGWHWTLNTSGDSFMSPTHFPNRPVSPTHFPNRPAAVNNFLLLITLGNAEIARALQAGGHL
jgi:hypothetical protein